MTIAPSDATLLSGFLLQLEAVLADPAGNVIVGRAVTWASSDVSIAAVDPTGLVTGFATGTAVITATSEGTTGSVLITVTRPLFIFSNRCLSSALQACASVTVETEARANGGTHLRLTLANTGVEAAYLSAVRFTVQRSIAVPEAPFGQFDPVPPGVVNTPVTGSPGAAGDWLSTLVADPGPRLLFQSHIGLDSDFGYEDPLATFVGDGFWGCSVQAPVGIGAISGYTTCGATPTDAPRPATIVFDFDADFTAADLTFLTLGFWRIEEGQLAFLACGVDFGPGCVDL